MKEMIDFLTYRSWYYQIVWYGMSFENARKLFNDAPIYEKIFKKERNI